MIIEKIIQSEKSIEMIKKIIQINKSLYITKKSLYLIYQIYLGIFPSRNKLFKYTREIKYQYKLSDNRSIIILFIEIDIIIHIIISIISSIIGSDMIFRDFNYMEIIIYSSPNRKDKLIYIDMDYEISSMDHQFFKTQYPKMIIHPLPSSIEIHDINNRINISLDYSFIIIFLSGKNINIDKSYLISIIYEFHLIDKFIYNILIDNDIIDPEVIKIDIIKHQVIIGSYENLIYPL